MLFLVLQAYFAKWNSIFEAREICGNLFVIFANEMGIVAKNEEETFVVMCQQQSK